MKITFLLATLLVSTNLWPQSSLTIEKIMQGESFTGYSPENLQWSPDGKKLYFTWNPAMEKSRSMYVVQPGTKKEPVKASLEERKNLIPRNMEWNRNRTKAVFAKNGDLYILDRKTGEALQITSTGAPEISPRFSPDEQKIIYNTANNIFSFEIKTGKIVQHTDFRPGKERTDAEKSDRDKWLYEDQLRLFSTLSERKYRRDSIKKENESLEARRPRTVYTGQDNLAWMQLSPDENYVIYLTRKPGEEKQTIVPNYVTESGYTEDIHTRSKVGTTQFSAGRLNILDIVNDTIYSISAGKIPGTDQMPAYFNDYPERKTTGNRDIIFSQPSWSSDGKFAAMEVYSSDNKDRWIMLLDVATGMLRLADRQHDEAWIGGPGIRGVRWMPDNRTMYFQSEETGYSHLYTCDAVTGAKKALTSGNFEIYSPELSADGKTWHFLSNEDDNGIRELYSMPAAGGKRTKLTSFGAGVEAYLSPDEKYFALRVSYSNTPWELYFLENTPNAKPVKITGSASPGFSSYNWRRPEFTRFRAADGTMVPARLYKPASAPGKGPAVIFVHGAGYLQNAHKWWSSYYREYMFHNYLVDNGYTVLDIDYRGSAGYGRDWRTAIYRHMGGKDLRDHIDGAKFLVENHDIDPSRIGIYGGSYGGFITLMALFTSPGTFAAGAALRPVTDWAHYNHGYTSGILNIPVLDSIAYSRSSPIYFAEGLKDHLLICHGMVDDNVHFQDVVRLAQKLIELGKENWELAVYPVESHGFVEPSSWIDEYKRIFRLFEEKLK